MTRREYLFRWSHWRIGPGVPLGLHSLVDLGLIQGARTKAPWLIKAEQRLADERDLRNTQNDTRYGGCQ